MNIEPVGPIRPIHAPTAVLHHGPTGESYERDGAEAHWGAGTEAAAGYDARARHGAPATLRGQVRPPTPFQPAHHERWGAYFWLESASEVVRVLLGPQAPFTAPALRLAPGDTVEVSGYRVHLHEEDALVAASVRHGLAHAELLDAARHRINPLPLARPTPPPETP